jgi:hypothetical protein
MPSDGRLCSHRVSDACQRLASMLPARAAREGFESRARGRLQRNANMLCSATGARGLLASSSGAGRQDRPLRRLAPRRGSAAASLKPADSGSMSAFGAEMSSFETRGRMDLALPSAARPLCASPPKKGCQPPRPLLSEPRHGAADTCATPHTLPHPTLSAGVWRGQPPNWLVRPGRRLARKRGAAPRSKWAALCPLFRA